MLVCTPDMWVMLYVPEGNKYSLARSTGYRGNLWRTQDSRCNSNWWYIHHFAGFHESYQDHQVLYLML